MKKKMNWELLFLLFTIGGAIATYVASMRNSNQQTRIEKLGQINEELGSKIRELGILNHEINQNIQIIVNKNQELINTNIGLTAQTKTLTTEVKTITTGLADAQKNLDRINQEINDKRLANTYFEVRRNVDDWYIGGSTSNESNELEKKHTIILNCIRLLEQEQTNPILTNNKSVFDSWTAFEGLMVSMNNLFNPDVRPDNLGMELAKLFTVDDYMSFYKIQLNWQEHGNSFKGWK